MGITVDNSENRVLYKGHDSQTRSDRSCLWLALRIIRYQQYPQIPGNGRFRALPHEWSLVSRGF